MKVKTCPHCGRTPKHTEGINKKGSKILPPRHGFHCPNCMNSVWAWTYDEAVEKWNKAVEAGFKTFFIQEDNRGFAWPDSEKYQHNSLILK